MRDFKFTFEPEIVKAKTSEQKGDLVIWAYASTYDVDSDDCQITRDALEGAKNDLLEYSTVLFNHNMDRPIGQVVETKIDEKGLLVKIVLSQTEKELMQKIQDGTLSKLSISGRAYDFKETSPDDEGLTILQITKIKLFEVSIVSVPANKAAKTLSSAIVKQLFLSKMSTEDEVDKSLLADLQVLSGKSTGETKEMLDRVLEFFKTTEQQDMKKNKEYTFSDKSVDRPVFQLTLSDTEDIELDDNSTFQKQLLKKGTWFHWGADKGKLNITEKKIDELIKNFKKDIVDSVPVPLTHSADPSMNTGQVIDLIKTEEGLDAVIEIKDETIATKIKKGLITAISASFDPNYLLKKTKKFVGPVLIHAALVSEPYIKGMNKFIALSDEFDGRDIIQLEDAEQDVEKQLHSVFDLLKNIQDTLVKKNEDVDEEETEEVEDETEEKKEEKDIEKAKKGDECKTKEGEKGTMKEDSDGKLVCIPAKTTKKEIDDSSTEETSDDESTDEVDESKEDESDEAAKDEKVDLADAEKLYDKYLTAGKVVPAQKDAFIALCGSFKSIQLADESVDASTLLNNFMKSQPKLINFDENGATEDVNEEKPDEKVDEMPTDVKDFYMNKMNLSEEKAVEAYKVAQATHDETAQKSTLFN